MKLPTNESPLDRILRIAVGIGFVGFALAGIVAAPASYVVWALAAILIVTGAVGFCPLYALVGVSTKRATR